MECGNIFVCCLDRSGKAYCWGGNYYEQCGTTNNDGSYSILQSNIFKRPSIFTANKVTHIGCGWEFTILMDNEMSLYVLGNGGGRTKFCEKVCPKKREWTDS
eukprot:555379_1